MTDILTLERHGGVAHLKLNRPAKKNALSLEMFTALPEAVEALAEDRSVRALVISGAGGDFCSGMDMANFANPKVLAEKFENPEKTYPNFFQRPAWCLRQAPFPVIAAIEGVCLGGGLQIALAADMRYATADATLSIMEIKWGMIPDMSASQTLRELVGIDQAKELAFTGKKINGNKALELGLVTRLEDKPVEEALKTAEQIAEKNPDAIRGTKALYQETWQSPDGLEAEERIQKGIVFQPNQMEAAIAAFEGRAAKFSDE